MLEPLNVRVDPEFDIAYVAYLRLPRGKTVASGAAYTEGVVLDFDAAGRVIGIEVMGFDELTLKNARNIARGYGLAFPARIKSRLGAPPKK